MVVVWAVFILYVVVTLGLAWLGKKKTTGLASFALGDGKMNPWVVGLALAASMTSTATFVVNPGIVYAYGLSAVLGYGVSAGLGMMVGLVILTRGFRRFVTRGGKPVLTVPDWIGQRYDDDRLAVFYAVMNLLLIAMVVLVCYAMAALLVPALGLEQWFGEHAFVVALALTVVFVFVYVGMGGTFAHAYTNTAQGVAMIGVAIALLVSGFGSLVDDPVARLAAIDPMLAEPINPSSVLFRNVFEVFGANFVIGFALALQPHFLVKALYVKSDRDVTRYLALAVVVGVLFTCVLLCGLFARLDPSGAVAAAVSAGKLGIDGVMPAYIVATFDPGWAGVFTIAILAAGMSTLDGILVALTAIFANDLYMRAARRRIPDPEERAAAAFKAGKGALVGLAIVTFLLAWYQHANKELSIAIFAQQGLFALLAATFVPLLVGIFDRPVPKQVVFGSSVVALVVHFGLLFGKVTLVTDADYTNPGLTAALALLASLVPPLVWALRRAVIAARTLQSGCGPSHSRLARVQVGQAGCMGRQRPMQPPDSGAEACQGHVAARREAELCRASREGRREPSD